MPKKTVDDYQQSYDQAIKYQEEINSPNNAVWMFLFGFTQDHSLSQDLSQYSNASACMSVSLNDYVYTKDQVKTYFDSALNL